METYKNFKAETVGIERFDKIRQDGRLLIEYVRGSTAYGLNGPTSDIDTGGVYMCTPEELLGYMSYHEEVADAKSDNKWFEIGNFINLLVKANPNILEALFVDDRFIIGEIHPIMQKLRDNRDMFLTKKCFNTLFGYATSQIVKARGLNKKIVNPIVERKTPLDFAFTYYKQGSTQIEKWLEHRGLDVRYCGLNNIPNMHDCYGLYYDFGNHILNEPGWETNEKLIHYAIELCSKNHDIEFTHRMACDWLRKQKPIGYRGLVCEKIENTTQLRLSSIPDKNALPLCHLTFNVSGYTDHCRKYKEYKEWEVNRNPARYESNLDKNYDSKNMMHCFRLIRMGKEIAKGEGMKLFRTEDRDFLMNIRNHKYEYDELINLLEVEKKEMNELMEHSNIPDSVDFEKLNQMLIDIRTEQIRNSNILNK